MGAFYESSSVLFQQKIQQKIYLLEFEIVISGIYGVLSPSPQKGAKPKNVEGIDVSPSDSRDLLFGTSDCTLIGGIEFQSWEGILRDEELTTQEGNLLEF